MLHLPAAHQHRGGRRRRRAQRCHQPALVGDRCGGAEHERRPAGEADALAALVAGHDVQLVARARLVAEGRHGSRPPEPRPHGRTVAVCTREDETESCARHGRRRLGGRLAALRLRRRRRQRGRGPQRRPRLVAQWRAAAQPLARVPASCDRAATVPAGGRDAQAARSPRTTEPGSSDEADELRVIAVDPAGSAEAALSRLTLDYLECANGLASLGRAQPELAAVLRLS